MINMSVNGMCLAEQRVRARKMKIVSSSFFLDAFFFFISPTTIRDLVEVEVLLHSVGPAGSSTVASTGGE